MGNMIKEEVKYPFLIKPVEVYTLENGHKVVLAYKEGGLVNISTWVKTGSINENDQNNGVSHFLEHLMFKGTTKYEAGYFDKTLEGLGGIINAATWKDYTFYYVTIPKGPEDKYFDQAIDLHADMMLDPILPEDELGEPFDFATETPKQKRERLVVIEEIRMRQDQPTTKLYNSLNAAMYTQHPYKRDVIGTPEIIASIPRDSVMNYYKKFYTPNNMTTIVVGEFDNAVVLDKIKKAFDFKGRENFIIPKLVLDKPKANTSLIENKAQVNTGFLMFGFLGSICADLKPSIGLEIIADALGDGLSSRLYQNLIEKASQKVFNNVSGFYYHFRDGGNFFIQANFEPDKKDLAVELIKNELSQILENGISERELKKAKKRLKVAIAATSETVSDIADNIGFYMTVSDNLKIIEDYVDILENFTLEDVQKIAKEYLTLDKATISVLLPE